MSNEIPAASREALKVRDRGQCLRCGMAGTDWHHRKRRREGGHGPGNGATLCGLDHRWVHANPLEARDLGFIVHTADDYLTIPIKTFMGWVLLDDDGGMTPIKR